MKFVELCAGGTDGNDLGMGGGIVVGDDTIVATADESSSTHSPQGRGPRRPQPKNARDAATWLDLLCSTIGETALAVLHSTPPAPPHSILTSLINDLAGLPGPFALVLDDYHVIVTPPLHEALAFLLDHLPRQIHLIITTRADPPLPFARLRVRDRLTEIRVADLRFTPDEAADFFNRVMQLNLSTDNSAALAQRTEGWIAGLQLAALSLQRAEDTADFITAFTGTHRYIVDYLIEEVLDRQPEATQLFLLFTSMLDRFAGPACDALKP